jgi:hypothetical protein
MKKLLMSSIVLLVFSASILIFQASCKKEAAAESPVQQNLIIYTLGLKDGTNIQLWLANGDGTNKRQVAVTVPQGSSFTGQASLAPDGRIIYLVSKPTSVGWQDELWAMSTTGANAVKLLDNSNDNTKDMNLLGVY